jgi:hypothetical protein
MPAYNRPDALPRTLESLLSQTHDDFALVITDDHPTPEVAAIVHGYAGGAPPVIYEANHARLGMVGNWRKVFARARELYPRSEYFAWVSDHDVWHARWLQELVGTLDADPEVVLAYPGSVRMVPDGVRTEKPGLETRGMTRPGERLRKAAQSLPAGDAIYGLMRADALQAAGVFRHVITPDRQVLLALSLLGQFAQVPEVLWYREVLRVFDLGRQREAFFPDGAPLYSYLPSHLQHAATLLWDFGVQGRGRPQVGRLAGVGLAATQLWISSIRQVSLPKSTWRLTLGTQGLMRWITPFVTTTQDHGARPAASAGRATRTEPFNE